MGSPSRRASVATVIAVVACAGACGCGGDAARSPDASSGGDAATEHAAPPDLGAGSDARDVTATGDAVAGDASTGDALTGQPCPGARPDLTNTGVPAGVALTQVNQDVTVIVDNTTIDGQDIHGFLIIQASHVRVARSIVRGRATSSNAAVIRVNSGSDILIEDTEVAVAFPSATVDGVWGANFTARRLNIHGGVDGIKASSNDTIECSYIHDLASFSSDPNQGGGPTHNDAIQILEGTTIRIAGNQLLAAMTQNAAIQITQDFGAVNDVRIEGNWADGGGCTFNISHNGAASLTGISVVGNRFGRSSFYACPILKSTQTTLVLTNNVWDNDGTPVPVQTHD